MEYNLREPLVPPRDGGGDEEDAFGEQQQSEASTSPRSCFRRCCFPTTLNPGRGRESHLRVVLRLIKPWEVVFILAVGVVNTFLSKLLGYIPGDFYTYLSERDRPHFVATLKKQLILIAACSVTFGSVSPLAEYLSFRWRKRLTFKLHGLYSRKHRYYRLEEGGEIDNPDQRIQRDVDFLCKSLSTVSKLVCLSPFQIAYFSYFCFHFLGARLMLFMYVYFFATLLAQKFVVASITPLVVKREKAEADFRSSHFRMRRKAEEIALSSGNENREKSILDKSLGGVLRVQKKLVLYHWGLSLTSSLIDYLGAAMNYVVIAVALFSREGIWNVDKTKLPQEISNASFIIFQLIYCFSQLSDTAKELSSLLGYVERVGELIQHFSDDDDDDTDNPLGGKAEAEKKKKGKRRRGEGLCLLQPKSADLNGRVTEYSIHKLDGKTSAEVLSAVFPDLTSGDRERVLAVPVFQCAALGIDLNPDSGCPADTIASEMNKLHLNFVKLESDVYRSLTQAGYFCDSVDPLTGCAMHSRCGKRYSEVLGAQKMLGYKVKECKGGCPLVFHPKFGSSSYPATIFSSAPADVIQTEIEKALHQLKSTSQSNSHPAGIGAASAASSLLVGMRNVSLGFGSRVVLSNVSFEVGSGESLYVCGPSGSGKTLLIKALCNLVRVDSGEISMPDLSLVVVLSQNPLMVHNGSIEEQIVYPHTTLPEGGVLEDILTKTGLSHHIDNNNKEDRPLFNLNQMSKAEIQKICIARVLYHKPLLALLDDALSSLSDETQEHMCKLLRDHGIGYVSTGSNSAIEKLHRHVLHL